MIDRFLKYQINIFVNTDSIVPEPNIISKLLELFKNDGLIPSTIYEMGPAGQTFRLRMSTTDNRWSIAFLSRNINIEHLGENEPQKDEMDNFLTTAKKLTNKIFGYLGQKSNRLAFIVDFILKEMDQAKLESCYSKFFEPLPTYQKKSPFEWNNRSVSQEDISLAGTTEKMNVITEIKRMKAQIISKEKEIKKLERIFIQYEINTIPENKETRFGVEQFGNFVDIANEKYSQIFSELESRIND